MRFKMIDTLYSPVQFQIDGKTTECETNSYDGNPYAYLLTGHVFGGKELSVVGFDVSLKQIDFDNARPKQACIILGGKSHAFPVTFTDIVEGAEEHGYFIEGEFEP